MLLILGVSLLTLNGVAIGLLFNESIGSGWKIISMACFVLVLAVMVWLLARMKKKMSSRTLEMDRNGIRIKDMAGATVRYHMRNDIVSIEVQDKYRHSGGESLSDFWKELNKDHIKNSITVEEESGAFRYEFILDSSYMIEQLNSVVKTWEQIDANIVKTIEA